MEDEHEIAAELELLSGLLRSTGTTWTLADWERVLGELPPRYRRVVILTTIHGMTFESIGERLECSRGRVGQMWHAALKRLKGRVLTTADL